jgi:methyl-accepting chemotaxis protein
LKENPNIIALLIGAITALGGTIVFLALYIRKMHNTQIKRADEDRKELLTVIKENTQVNADMRAAIQTNTIATTNAAEQTSRSMDRLNNTVENLNRDVLKKGDRP